MRLYAIHLRNYRSFGDTTIDLSGLTAATVTGPTGSGKSSIIDGLLWALYGVQRGDQYQKIGTDTTAVEVVWQSNGTTYRVVRTRSTKTKAGKSDLSFSIKGGGGAWTALGGKTIAETEAAIVRAIGMEYATITSGPISLQGESSKFCQPPEVRIDGKVYTGRQARIRILQQMLGLGVYETLHKAASEQGREADREAGVLEAQVGQAAAALCDLQGLTERELSARQAIESARASITTTTALLDQATRQLARLEAQIPAAEKELSGYADVRAAVDSRRKTIGAKQGRVEYARGLIGRRQEITQAAETVAELDILLAKAREEAAGLEAEGKGVKAQSSTADTALQAAQMAADKAGEARAQALQGVAKRPKLESQIGRLTIARTNRVTIADRMAQTGDVLTAKQSALSRIMAANLAAQKAAGEIATEARGIKIKIDLNGATIQDKEQRSQIMTQVPCMGVDGLPDRCPLLADARVSAGLLPQLREEHAALCSWVRPLSPPQQDTAPLRAEISAIEGGIAADRRTLSSLDAEILTLQPAEAELASLETIAATIPGLEADEATAMTARDVARKAADILRLSLVTAQERYLVCRAKAKDAESARTSLTTTAALSPALAQADRDLPVLETEIAQLEGEIAVLQAQLAGELTTAAWLEESRRCVVGLQTDMAEERAEIALHQLAERKAVQTAAECRAEIGRLEALEVETAKAREEAGRLRTRHSTLTLLAEAYRAIPLMILEHMAIPALEMEANRILARISRSGMRLRLETQREVKSCDTLADSLDIVVTDQVGQRAYEDYSGGQNFQIDLALRIALAKLQAHRAGQAVETLIIDEGFGTQSAECLDGIMDALRAVQEEFPLLLVVSHVEALRDTFGSRISVSGGPEDSRAEVIVG